MQTGGVEENAIGQKLLGAHRVPPTADGHRFALFRCLSDGRFELRERTNGNDSIHVCSIEPRLNIVDQGAL